MVSLIRYLFAECKMLHVSQHQYLLWSYDKVPQVIHKQLCENLNQKREGRSGMIKIWF